MKILIVGVGGQGTLLASKVLGEYASLQGLDCKLSEVHGMSQRGGSVVTHVVMGGKVHSAIVEEGQADAVLAFEELEALRVAHYAKEGGYLLVNTQNILPLPCIIGAVEYPNDLDEQLASTGKNVKKVDAYALSLEAGNVKTVNSVMLGVLGKVVGLDMKVLEQSLRNVVPAKVIDVNIQAFNLGANCIK